MNASFVGRRWLVGRWRLGVWQIPAGMEFRVCNGRYNESGSNRGTNDIVCIEDLL
jgi:hypothetical protein